jgi:hypothetical protein
MRRSGIASADPGPCESIDDVDITPLPLLSAYVETAMRSVRSKLSLAVIRWYTPSFVFARRRDGAAREYIILDGADDD